MNRFARHVAITLALSVSSTLALTATAFAQPAKPPVKILVGYPPGGGADAGARILADVLKDALGAPVLVENKPGAGGQIAAQALKSAAPDGNTLMFTLDHQVVMLRHVLKDPGFDAERDFAPIARVMTYTLCAAVHPSNPAKDLAGWAASIKADEKNGNFGMPAPGSNGHFMGYVVGRTFGVKVNPVAYRGAAPALADLLGGQLPAAFMPCDILTQHHAAGKVRIIGVAANRRLSALPDVQTMAEAGVNVPTDYYTALYAPAGVPAPVLEQLRAAVQKLLTDPAVASKLNATGMVTTYGDAATLERITRESAVFWGNEIRASGFQPN